VLLVGLVATCGIQWLDIVSAGSLSLKWFHGPAIALLAVTVLVPDLGGRLVRVLEVWGAFWAAWAVYLSAIVVAQVVHDDPYFPLPHVPKQLLYSSIALAAAVAAFSLASPFGRRAAAWAAGAAAALGLIVLCRPLLASGVNPATITWSAIRTGQPDQIIYGIFQRAFIGTDVATADPVQANLRHGLASALALAIFLTALVRPTLDRHRRRVADAGIVLAASFLALTLSRSAILAVLVWVLIMALTPLVRGRAPLRQWLLPALLVVGAVAVFVLPAGQLFEERFVGEQGSAEVRGTNSTEVIEAFDRYALGANDLSIDASPHNVVLDGLLAGGYVAAAAGLVLLGTYVLILGRLVGDHLAERPWALPLSRAAAIGIGVVPLVRLISAGGGLLNLAEWVGAGTFMGLVALERRQRERVPDRSRTSPSLRRTAATAGPSR
jgi:hypothetical protein